MRLQQLPVNKGHLPFADVLVRVCLERDGVLRAVDCPGDDHHAGAVGPCAACDRGAKTGRRVERVGRVPLRMRARHGSGWPQRQRQAAERTCQVTRWMSSVLSSSVTAFATDGFSVRSSASWSMARTRTCCNRTSV